TVCPLTAARRPLISVRKIRQSVPSPTAHKSLKRYSAPAWADVAIDPTSRNPPTLVAMPRAISPHFFIAAHTRRAVFAPPRWQRASARHPIFLLSVLLQRRRRSASRIAAESSARSSSSTRYRRWPATTAQSSRFCRDPACPNTPRREEA